jgi:hypothetical protein
MTPIEQLQKRADESPGTPVTGSDIKVLIQELKEQGRWLETSNRVLTSRLNQLKRKCDSSYVFGSSEASLRQQLADVEKRQRDMERIISKITNRIW